MCIDVYGVLSMSCRELHPFISLWYFDEENELNISDNYDLELVDLEQDIVCWMHFILADKLKNHMCRYDVAIRFVRNHYSSSELKRYIQGFRETLAVVQTVPKRFIFFLVDPYFWGGEKPSHYMIMNDVFLFLNRGFRYSNLTVSETLFDLWCGVLIYARKYIG